jgi:hypothetical protein
MMLMHFVESNHYIIWAGSLVMKAKAALHPISNEGISPYNCFQLRVHFT